MNIITEGLLIDPSEMRTILENTAGHCPCVAPYGRSQDTLCQCKEFRENNVCMCGYYKDSTTRV